MGTSALPLPRRRLGAVTAATWAAALTGATVGMAALFEDGGRPAPVGPTAAKFVYGLGERIPTTYGSASVDNVVRLTGPRAAWTVPVSGGAAGYQVSATLNNTSDRPLALTRSVLLPASGAAATAAVGAGGLRDGAIPPRTAQRVVVRFTTPASGSPLPDLVLTDPRVGRTFTVALGSSAGLPALDLSTHRFDFGVVHGGGR